MLGWQKRTRKRRLPFGEDLKLLRAPGETQLKLVRQLDENGREWLMFASFAPAVVAAVLLVTTSRLPRDFQVAGVAVTLLAFTGAFYLAARWLAGKFREQSNRYLGYFGERLVAEQLEPLKTEGWRIFHDVPFANNGTPFNIDHIAVGPGGVFAIETKTRRKGGARPGFVDHKVFFDGRDLVWPWGEDSHGLEQAERNALSLAGFIKAETGQHVHVTPVLTLPGWFVEMKPARESRPARVTNPKGLPKFLSGGSPVLNSEQITAIAARLEVRCRDVEY